MARGGPCDRDERGILKPPVAIAPGVFLSLEPGYRELRDQRLTRKINCDLRLRADRQGKRVPRPSFLSHARKVADTWPDIFGVNPKDVPYDHYRRIATSSLPKNDLARLRQWAETTRPSQAKLRQRIRTLARTWDVPCS
jgi:hypothetical protein